MKLRNIIYSLAALLMIAIATSCEGEKDLIIIEDDLPIKTSTLYMVGDATPAGWDIDSPTALTASADDALVFTWEGSLTTGEIKLCLTTGSWDAAFIRPLTDQEPISKTNITNATFQMHSGDPDEKWRVTDAGDYRLTFDLRNWTMSTEYLSEPAATVVTPIESDALYIVGDATPAGWSIDSPTATEKKSSYVYEWEGQLNTGEMKACTQTGDWNVAFVRPSFSGCTISKDGVEDDTIVYTTSPDDKWQITEAGIYHLTFNLQDYTFTAEWVSEIEVDNTPIESSTLYMIGDATPGGWSMDDATPFTQSADNKYIFTWEGTLVEGSMKACLEPDGTFSCPFLRPSTADVAVSSTGVAASDFVYTTSPDDQWKITESGTYRITFDLENYTITAEKL